MSWSQQSCSATAARYQRCSITLFRPGEFLPGELRTAARNMERGGRAAREELAAARRALQRQRDAAKHREKTMQELLQ